MTRAASDAGAGLPPPQFQRKQEHRDSWRNNQPGGRFNDKGPHLSGRYNDRGLQGVGRYNDKGSSQPPLLPTPPGNWQNPTHAWSGRSGATPANDLLVADMKLGAVGHQDEVLRMNCPQFQEVSSITNAAFYASSPKQKIWFVRKVIVFQLRLDL